MKAHRQWIGGEKWVMEPSARMMRNMLPRLFRQSCIRHHRRAFSLVELLVVVGILVILCSIFIPYVAKMREVNRRVGCANNMRQIYAAMMKYADAFGHDFPRTPSDPEQPAMYVAFTGADWFAPEMSPGSTAPSTVPTAPAAPPTGPDISVTPPPTTAPAVVAVTQPSTRPAVALTRPSSPLARPASNALQLNDVTASLWLLVKLGYSQPQAFVCPTASETPDPMLTGGKRVPVAQRSNFTSARHLSYSYSSPFSASPRFRLNSDTLPPDFAILADKNPGAVATDGNMAGPQYDAPRLELAKANSRNHDRAGQNVLYVTGEVRFQNTPYCGFGTGWKRDNIYTAYAATPLPAGSNPSPEANGIVSKNAGPAWEHDAYLVPADGE